MTFGRLPGSGGVVLPVAAIDLGKELLEELLGPRFPVDLHAGSIARTATAARGDQVVEEPACAGRNGYA
jgi:hypothetical protein